MSFWNSAIGAMIGFTLGGPIGALLGGVIGSRFGSRGKRSSFSTNQQHQVAFFHCSCQLKERVYLREDIFWVL